MIARSILQEYADRAARVRCETIDRCLRAAEWAVRRPIDPSDDLRTGRGGRKAGAQLAAFLATKVCGIKARLVGNHWQIGAHVVSSRARRFKVALDNAEPWAVSLLNDCAGEDHGF